MLLTLQTTAPSHSQVAGKNLHPDSTLSGMQRSKVVVYFQAFGVCPVSQAASPFPHLVVWLPFIFQCYSAADAPACSSPPVVVS